MNWLRENVVVGSGAVTVDVEVQLWDAMDLLDAKAMNAEISADDEDDAGRPMLSR